jgi:chaperonin cofactor prefoldin
MSLISERYDALETIGDRRMYLSTMSLCAGYSVKCLISLERYRLRGADESVRESISDCKNFVADFVSSLEGKKNAPLGLRKLTDFLSDQNGGQNDQSVQNWKRVSEVLTKAERGEKVSKQELYDAIDFLKRSIDTLNELRKKISERMNAPLFPREYL